MIIETDKKKSGINTHGEAYFYHFKVNLIRNYNQITIDICINNIKDCIFIAKLFLFKYFIQTQQKK